MHTSSGASSRLIGSDFSGPFHSQSTAIPHTTYSWNTTLAPVLTLPSLRLTPSCSLDGTKRPSSALHLASKPFLPQSTTEMKILYQVITSHITSLQLQASPKFHCGNDIRQPRLCRQCLYMFRRKSVRSLIRKASPKFSFPPKIQFPGGKSDDAIIACVRACTINTYNRSSSCLMLHYLERKKTILN